jgi:drug/metabolite transporter (DMT)-like permease
MPTKNIIYRIISGLIYGFIGYLLYELAREVFFTPESSVTQGWMAAFFTALLLLVLVPLSSFFWRGDEKGVLMVLIFLGALTIGSFVLSTADFLRPYFESLPSSVNLVFSLLSIIAPFYLPFHFLRWATKKIA